jgi:hypothetical protein
MEGQDRTLGQPDDQFGDAADEQVGKTRSPMGVDDDQIGILPFGFIRNFMGRIPESNEPLDSNGFDCVSKFFQFGVRLFSKHCGQFHRRRGQIRKNRIWLNDMKQDQFGVELARHTDRVMERSFRGFREIHRHKNPFNVQFVMCSASLCGPDIRALIC